MKLQPLLSEYLLENGSLPLPGDKQLFIERQSAVLKEADSIITSPGNRIFFTEKTATEQELQQLSAFISRRLSISEEQATELLHKEGNLQSAIADTETIDWIPLGSFRKQQNGLISFFEADALNNYLPVISLKQTQQQPQKETTEEVIEEAAEPTIMSEPLNELEEPIQKDYWWVWAIVILVVSLVLILFRFL